VQIWSIISLGCRWAVERYGKFTLYATFIEALAFLFFGTFTETTEKNMHFWILAIPAGLFAVAFIYGCGKAHTKLELAVEVIRVAEKAAAEKANEEHKQEMRKIQATPIPTRKPPLP
jgi:hypothetical protein